jgi:DNA polymerase-3 subunit chi
MLDDHLWQYREDSFLPHGLAGTPTAARQPVLLTTQNAIPNQAQALFAIDGANLDGSDGMTRVCVLFDGGDPASLSRAREQWKAVKAQGRAATYWKQTEAGGWAKAG